MPKIVYEDWREVDFNEEDYILKENLEDNFISKEDLEDNFISRDELEEKYVTREKYQQKKDQAKNAFSMQDKKVAEALKNSEAELEKRITERVSFQQRNKLDNIPKEIMEVKEKHPTLSRDEALKISGYTPNITENQAPWDSNPNIYDESKKVYTLEELSKLNEDQYNKIMKQVEEKEVSII